MKALVTGGAGFIGSNIASFLLEREYEVTILDNLMSGYRENLFNLPVKLIVGDICDAEAVMAAASGADVIFHLAASVGNKRSIDNPQLDSQINVLGTLNVLEAARTHGIQKVVASSSAGIFGELKTMPIREDHPVEPDTPYGASKLAAEKMALAYAKLYDMECICLRYFNVYGVNQRYDAYGNVIPIFVHKILAGEPITIFGDGEQTRDFVNVRDVARANYLASTVKGVSGAFNLGSATRITINHLVDLLRRYSGLTVDAEHGPPRRGDVRHSLADISLAKKDLGFRPSVPIEEGLPGYLHWAKSTNDLSGSR